MVVSVFSNWNCNAAIGQRYLTLGPSPNGVREDAEMEAKRKNLTLDLSLTGEGGRGDGSGEENLTLGPSPTGEGGREDGSENNTEMKHVLRTPSRLEKD